MLLSDLFPNFFEKQNFVRSKIVLFVDAGEAGSSGALIAYKGKNPEVVATVHSEKKLKKESLNNIQSTKNALSHVLGRLSEIVKAHRGKGVIYEIDKISVVVGAPFYICHTERITSTFEKPTTITLRTIESILSSSDKQTSSFQDVKVTAKRMSDVLINGYHTDEIYGKEATSLSFSLFTTAIDQKFYSIIESATQHYFKAPLVIDASAFAFSSALCSALPTAKNFLLVFVGNETSEIVLIKNRLLHESLSIPSGYETTLRSLAKRMKESPDTVRSMIKMRMEGKLTEKSSISLSASILEERGKWFSLLQDALIPLGDEQMLPEDVLLITEKDMRPLFAEFLSSKSFLTEGLSQGAFLVTVLNESNLSHYPHFRDGVGEDPLLGLSILFSEINNNPIKIHSEHNLASVI